MKAFSRWSESCPSRLWFALFTLRDLFERYPAILIRFRKMMRIAGSDFCARPMGSCGSRAKPSVEMGAPLSL
jgi:hypothetical protein